MDLGSLPLFFNSLSNFLSFPILRGHIENLSHSCLGTIKDRNLKQHILMDNGLSFFSYFAHQHLKFVSDLSKEQLELEF